MTSVRAAIIGSGNIGTDLMYKLLRSPHLEVRWMVGIDPASEGLALARSKGVEVVDSGLDALLAGDDLPDIVFEATSAKVHAANAGRYAELGIRAVDLTPAAVGPYVIPAVNLDAHSGAANLNMVTCGGQATIPMVHAVSRVADVEYAEIVASVSSRSAGPGTRANIDEFTRTTASAVEQLGGARRGKAIIILNPAEPPLLMQDTIYCSLPAGTDEAKVADSVERMIADMQEFVPGYRLRVPPQFDTGRVAIFIEVEGAGDYLPPYAGNLDIMTAAAVRVGEVLATEITNQRGHS